MKLPTLIKRANAEDETTGDAYEVFAFRKVGNRLGKLKLERDKARDSNAVFEALIRKNAALPSDREQALDVVQKAIRSRAQERVLYSSRCGWRTQRKAFVTCRSVIGRTAKRRLLQPEWLNGLQKLPMRSRGSVAEWTSTVATIASCSAPAMLSIAAAFAAPLLEVTGRQPFGINLFGPSKIGKTTAALAGASVIGIGREADLPNWADTHAAHGQQARIFNDMLMPINEAGLLVGSKKAAYAGIRTMIYSLGEGRERRRHSGSSYASPAAAEEFRTIFVSTAEHSFEHYARLAEERRDDGEYARCLDVPALARRKTIVSYFPGRIPETDRAKWARRKVIELRRACEQQHGTAFGPYVKYLIAHRDGLKTTIGGYCQEFKQAIRSRDVEGALEHAAENFALVYAGGCIGIDAGILPWSKAKLLRAIASCFGRALDELGRVEDVEVRARRRLRVALRKADIVERRKGAAFSEARHHGYFRQTAGTRTYVVHAKRFREWFESDDELAAALAWLELKGFLCPRRSKAGAPRGGGSWAEQTPKWPHGKSVRSIVFREPFRKASG